MPRPGQSLQLTLLRQIGILFVMIRFQKNGRTPRLATLVCVLALCAGLLACRLSARPAPPNLKDSLLGAWEDPLTGWVYTFAEDGAYVGHAPPLADGVNRIIGTYLIDEEGYIEIALAHPVPRRPFTFYERHNVWRLTEVSDEQLLLVYGRNRLRLVRRSAQP